MALKKLLKDLPPSTRYSASPPKNTDSTNSYFFWSIGAALALLFIWSIGATELWYHERSENRETQLTLAIFRQEWDQTKTELDSVKKRNQQLESSLRDAQTELDKARLAKQQAEENLNALKGSYQTLRDRFMKFWLGVRSQGQGESLGAAISKPDVSVEAPRQNEIATTLPAATAPQPPKISEKDFSLKGSVLSINAVYQFAIVDLGRKNGLKEGEDLFVMRSGALRPGKLRVERLYDNLSACTIMLEDTKDLKPGDIVVRR